MKNVTAIAEITISQLSEDEDLEYKDFLGGWIFYQLWEFVF